MGGIRRIKRNLTQPIAMADTKVAFNNCKVFLAHPNPAVAQKVSVGFAGFIKYLNERASLINMRDLYEAHFRLLSKMKSGEDLVKGEPSNG